jgi:hypothetical protein
MSNIVEFVLKLKDMMSGQMPKIASATRSTFSSIDNTISKTQKGLNDLGNGVALKVDASGIEQAGRDVDKLSGKLARLNEGGQGNGRGIGAGGIFLGNLAAQGAMMAGREIVDTGKNAFENGIQLENMKVGLQTFVGDRADAIVEGVLKQAFYTPFTTASLLPIEMGFISTGMDDKRANRDMMNLANAVAATGGNDFILSRIGSDMMGAAAKGTIQGRELMELQRTGHINIEALVAKDLFPGMNLQKAQAKVEDMDISFKEFESAIQRASDKGGMFAGALERLSQTIGGKNSTIKDMWWNMTAKLTESQSEPIKRIQDAIIGGLSDIPAILGKLTPVIDRLFDGFSQLWPSIRDFGGAFLDLLKPIGSVLISDGFIKFGKGLVDFATTIEQILLPPMKLLGSSIQWVVDQLPKGKEPAVLGDDRLHAVLLQQPADSLLKKQGLAVDDSALSKMEKAYGWTAKFFKTETEIDAYNQSAARSGRHQFSDFDKLTVPLVKAGDAQAGKGANSNAATDASNAIMSGGPRQNIFNFNAPLYKVDKQVFEKVKDAVNGMEGEVREALVRILYSVPG